MRGEAVVERRRLVQEAGAIDPFLLVAVWLAFDGDAQDHVLSQVLLKLLRDAQAQLAVDRLSLFEAEVDAAGVSRLSLHLFARGLSH